MPRVELTSHLARHVGCPPEDVDGATLREAIEAYLTKHPTVRSYLCDEQGTLRRHVVLSTRDASGASTTTACFRSDAGKTREVLDRGLPSSPAYDIAFRHALDVDEKGDSLALGSTTGSLWVSEDAGDAWTCLTAHLPQIYAVRFE